MKVFSSISFFFSLLLSVAAAAHGQSCTTATCTAASASESDVLAALPSSSNSNSTVVVKIPSGSASWTSQLNYTIPSAVTNLTIQGTTSITWSGTPGTSNYSYSLSDSTVISDADSSDSTLVNIKTGSASTYFRMTGITFQGGSGGSAKYNGAVAFAGDSKNFRLDHCHFNSNTYSPAVNPSWVRVNGTIEGVVDHNVLDMGGSTNFSNGIQAYDDVDDTVGNGDGTWATATGWGTNKFLFMESNYITGSFANDCYNAARMTLRYNYFKNTYVAAQAHPTKTTAGANRGCRALEVYKNYIADPNATPVDAVIGSPIGPALIWGNTLASGGYRFYAAATYRNADGQQETNAPQGWGYCGTATINPNTGSANGTGSPWDGNMSTSTGYPCLDGIGRGQTQQTLNGQWFPNLLDSSTGSIAWPRQMFEPVYLVMNTISSGNTVFNAYAQVRDHSSVLGRDVVYDCGTFTNGVTNPECPNGFTGANGAGFGVLSNRPSSCTAGQGGTYFTSPTGSYGVAYFATDANSGNGELYVCTSTNTWTAIYQPYTYPHPLVSGNSTTAGTPPPPTNLLSTVY